MPIRGHMGFAVVQKRESFDDIVTAAFLMQFDADDHADQLNKRYKRSSFVVVDLGGFVHFDVPDAGASRQGG